jgi:hypothetical protein
MLGIMDNNTEANSLLPYTQVVSQYIGDGSYKWNFEASFPLKLTLRRQCHEIFDPRFFFVNQLSLSPGLTP